MCPARAKSCPRFCGAGMQDEAARAMEPMPLTSGNLGRLQQEDTVSQREGTSVGSPAQSPMRMARQALAALDEVSICLALGAGDIGIASPVTS